MADEKEISTKMNKETLKLRGSTKRQRMTEVDVSWQFLDNIFGFSFRSTDFLASLMLSFIFQCPYNFFEHKYFNTIVSLFWFRFCFQFQMLFSMTKSSMMRVHTRIGSTGRLTYVKCVPALCFTSVDCTLATMGKFKNWLDNKYEGCLRIPNSKIKLDGMMIFFA